MGDRSIDRWIDRISIQESEIFRCRVVFRKYRASSIELRGIEGGGGVEKSRKRKKERKKEEKTKTNESLLSRMIRLSG